MVNHDKQRDRTQLRTNVWWRHSSHDGCRDVVVVNDHAVINAVLFHDNFNLIVSIFGPYGFDPVSLDMNRPSSAALRNDELVVDELVDNYKALYTAFNGV